MKSPQGILVRPATIAKALLLASAAAVGLAVSQQETYDALSARLERESWVPPYFAGRVPIFDPRQHEPLVATMRQEPFEEVRAGRYAYRTSPARIELGRRLFETYDWGTAETWRPAQRYTWYSLGLTTAEELQARYGVRLRPDGTLLGLTGMVAQDGKTDYGWTCAMCHATLDSEGRVVLGSPNHKLAYGLMHHRALVTHPSRPAAPGPGLIDKDTPLADLISLGPGRIDMNGDRRVNAVKIPSLWGLRSLRSGIFANGSIGNIWMGIPHNGGPFPASDLIEAVVAYVLSLEPPPNPAAAQPAAARGRKVFEGEGCASCHAGGDYTNGEVIPLPAIGTDPSRAAVEFPKGYKVPSLRRLDLQQLFLHDGSADALAPLFSKERLNRIKGHEYGLDLAPKEKDDLVAFLLSL